MKIILKRDGNPLRIYHHPREVVVHPKACEVEIFKSDGTVLEKYELLNKECSWLENVNNDTAEIVLTLEVGAPKIVQ